MRPRAATASASGGKAGGAAQAKAAGQARETHLCEEAAVDEEDRDLLAVAAGELGILIDVDDFPLVRLIFEQRVDLFAHLLAEVTVRPAEEAKVDQRSDALSAAELLATW
jgi:hypothetical protein